MKKIAILGSTGSIGTSLINIIKKDKKNFKIELLTTNKNYKKILKQAKNFNVKNVVIINKESFLIAKKITKKNKINIYNDFNSFNKIFKKKKIDYTMSAISGFFGLIPTIEIIKFTRTIAIANKESIICGWCLIKKEIRKYNVKFIPVDSEHFSIWSLAGDTKSNNIEKIYLTASGGPFRDYPLKEFKNITLKKALKHPNWSMGKKISIDSATMMNKVFEVIEAKKIFNLKYNQLEILLHPDSYLHAIVKFRNGLTKILAHDTSMTIPIFNSIYLKNEKNIRSQPLNIKMLNDLKLKFLNPKIFPSIRLLNLLKNKDSLFETVIVSANDTLVNLFLKKHIKFTDISKILLKIVKHHDLDKYHDIKVINVAQIVKLNKYVSLKVKAFCV